MKIWIVIALIIALLIAVVLATLSLCTLAFKFICELPKRIALIITAFRV